MYTYTVVYEGGNRDDDDDDDGEASCAVICTRLSLGARAWRRLRGANKSDTKHCGQMDLLKVPSRCSSFQLISMASAT